MNHTTKITIFLLSEKYFPKKTKLFQIFVGDLEIISIFAAKKSNKMIKGMNLLLVRVNGILVVTSRG